MEHTSSLRKGDKALFPVELAFEVVYGSKEPHLPCLNSRGKNSPGWDGVQEGPTYHAHL